MEITEVRIKLMEESEDRLRAFCSVTFDHSFVVRDLKIIEGTSGPFVAMPSRKLTGRCNRCGYKNHLRSNFCNQCGTRLRGGSDLRDQESSSNRLYADIAHPINQACRDLIQQEVILEYAEELQRAKVPGYQSRYDDDYYESEDSTGKPAVRDSLVNKPHFDTPKPSISHAIVSQPSNHKELSDHQLDSEKQSGTDSSDPSTSFGLGILDPSAENP